MACGEEEEEQKHTPEQNRGESEKARKTLPCKETAVSGFLALAAGQGKAGDDDGGGGVDARCVGLELSSLDWGEEMPIGFC